jgi:NAD(P)-dependent dehydrogenase (short-subunit alcohol dehydrogenase family)
MDFADKQILITGASRGIGYATAQEFLALGARVAVNGRTEQSVATAIDELGGGDRLIAAPGSVATVDGCEAIVKAAIEGLGGLDVLVNNAGVSIDATIEKSDEAIWDETLDVNLKGTFFCVRAALPALRESAGAIVNVASVSGLQGSAEGSVYCASKGGVVNLTRALAMELAPDIRVNCVCPGWVDTDMLRRDYVDLADDPAAAEREAIEEAPLKRVATAEEIAKAIAYLASHDARFITGAALPIDGGGSAGH